MRLKGLTVLVIEDDPESLDLLTLYLGIEGAAVVGASSAASALDISGATKADLVLCDLMLEGEDGCTVLKRLRERAGWAKVPAIAMSGMVDQASRHRAEAAGFNDYAIKPLGLEKLTSCIALLAQRAARCS